MRKLIPAIALLVSATAALAHDGVHMHPHGSESWIATALGLGLVGIAALAFGRLK